VKLLRRRLLGSGNRISGTGKLHMKQMKAGTGTKEKVKERAGEGRVMASGFRGVAEKRMEETRAGKVLVAGLKAAPKAVKDRQKHLSFWANGSTHRTMKFLSSQVPEEGP